MHELLYLSKDKLYLTDNLGSNMYSMVQDGERVYYKTIAVESEAFEKVCTGSTSVRICSIWNNAHECHAFANVDVCTKWKLIPKGYSNIS